MAYGAVADVVCISGPGYVVLVYGFNL